MGFEFIVKHEGKKVQRSKVKDLTDFDPVLEGLKEKFGFKKERRKNG